jgi:hypothetical protein
MGYLTDDPSVMRDASRQRHRVLDILGTPNETPVGMWGGAPDDSLAHKTRMTGYQGPRCEVMEGTGDELAEEGGRSVLW